MVPSLRRLTVAMLACVTMDPLIVLMPLVAVKVNKFEMVR